MRALGLDIGTKTIGLAVADELGFTAQGLDTIRRTSTKNDIAAVKRVVDEYLVTVLVLGLPLNMDGTEGSRAEACRKFGTYLHDTLKIEVEYQDERLTTVAAHRMLIDGDVSREKRREVVDQIAASLILQGWLDARAPRPSTDD